MIIDLKTRYILGPHKTDKLSVKLLTIMKETRLAKLCLWVFLIFRTMSTPSLLLSKFLDDFIEKFLIKTPRKFSSIFITFFLTFMYPQRSGTRTSKISSKKYDG
ncbi:hypothetical protein V1477_004415 [Vespula maculifrons]|uniref:Uncharacterized protein n=1 Tax=Vespula maculifrons TaxID=7453 RepID=A0ABD2CU68_VESMC